MGWRVGGGGVGVVVWSEGGWWGGVGVGGRWWVDSPVTSEFLTQGASNAQNVSI